MAISAEQLNIILSARDKEFTKAMDRAQRRVERFASKSQKSLSASGAAMNAFSGVAKRFAPVLAASFSLQTLQNVGQFAREIENLSALAGVSIEGFQGMAFASQRYGISQEKLADILKDVNDKIGDFMQTGGGPMKDFFENIAPKVGITADAFRKLNSADALQLYVSSLEKAGVSQQEMTFYMEALASDSAMLTPLLANNGEEMGKLADKARSLGIVLDEDLIRQTAQMDQVWSTVMTSMSRNFTAFAAHVITGFDNIFGITSFGQYNMLARKLGDLQTEANDLTATLAEVDATGTFSFDEFSGSLGRGYTNAADAAAGLKSVNQEIMTTQAEMDQVLVLLDKLNNAKAAIQDTPSMGAADTGGGGGGGKSETQKLSEELEKLLASLSDVTKAEQDFAAAQKTLNDAMAAGLISTEEAQAALAVLKTKLDMAKGAAIDFESIAQTIENSMENAFMGMIDGTESVGDAFKSMARDIIKELYRVLVVQQLVGTLKTGGGGILGAIAPYVGRASGGVVQAGQPTTVGEHGRELFVPSQGGRVLSVAQSKDAINGGGNSVTVIQNNTFGSGVSRAEINSMLPKIVETTKAAVFDAQRRSVTGR